MSRELGLMYGKYKHTHGKSFGDITNVVPSLALN